MTPCQKISGIEQRKSAALGNVYKTCNRSKICNLCRTFNSVDVAIKITRVLHSSVLIYRPRFTYTTCGPPVEWP
jgi:hypothetical protein